MPVSAQPHSSWADVYDLAYERSFGDFYRQLTDVTIELISDVVRPPASIVDFGAGTGRLSIPLAQLGFSVTAVDPCLEMLRQLERRKGQVELRTVQSTMEDFESDERFEVALCVFTVLLYLLDEAALTKAAQAANNSLKSGGILLIDIPTKALFQGYSRTDQFIERSVSVAHRTGDTYSYRERLTVKEPSKEDLKYEDNFLIRYWRQEQVMCVFQASGFVLETDVSDHFAGAGSSYLLLKKAN